MPSSKLQIKLNNFIKNKIYRRVYTLSTFLYIFLLMLHHSREPTLLANFISKFFSFIYNNYIFPDYSFVLLNLFYIIELIIKFLIQKELFFIHFWNLTSLFISTCFFFQFALYYGNKNLTNDLIHILINSIQLLRICLVIKDFLFLKRFFRTLKIVLSKSLSIIILFFFTVFFFGLLGKIFKRLNKIKII